MAAHDYHFVTTWRVEGSVDEVAQILADVTALTRWWPAVYLEVRELAPGAPDGVGKVVDLFTKGWLPYTLRWRFTVTEVAYARRVVLEAEGDFAGRGIWLLAQEGPTAVVVYDWRIRADKPLLRRMSALLKPVFAANHRWAMAMGERSLRLELARRRATTPEARARIPPPPGPTTASPLPLAAAAAAATLGIALAVRVLRRRRHPSEA
jgi:hypothetical protein